MGREKGIYNKENTDTAWGNETVKRNCEEQWNHFRK
jgi:hypothetical protein